MVCCAVPSQSLAADHINMLELHKNTGVAVAWAPVNVATMLVHQDTRMTSQGYIHLVSVQRLSYVFQKAFLHWFFVTLVATFMFILLRLSFGCNT